MHIKKDGGFPFVINFLSMMKLENLKYTAVNEIRIVFNNVW
jgi:hypothetical protein